MFECKCLHSGQHSAGATKCLMDRSNSDISSSLDKNKQNTSQTCSSPNLLPAYSLHVNPCLNHLQRQMSQLKIFSGKMTTNLSTSPFANSFLQSSFHMCCSCVSVMRSHFALSAGLSAADEAAAEAITSGLSWPVRTNKLQKNSTVCS